MATSHIFLNLLIPNKYLSNYYFFFFQSQELAEFSALEEEASRSVFRDQTEKEANDLETHLETSQRRLNELERQQNQVALATASEVTSLQARRSDYLQRLQQVKIKTI